VNIVKIKLLGSSSIIMSNPYSHHNYFAWPSVTRLRDGRLAVAASGFRLQHICPFGKTVIAFSEDEGKTFTPAIPIIDTPLDDRDGGILAFGNGSVIVTSFNNTPDQQRQWDTSHTPYIRNYLDTVTPEETDQYLGSTFRISQDNGTTFGPIHKSPVTSPHGPTELQDGTLLWVGCLFDNKDPGHGEASIQAYRIRPDGSMTFVGRIPNLPVDSLHPCEPHAIELNDGSLLCHIRMEKTFTIYQSVSFDKGATWSTPERILEDRGGSPPHLLQTGDGLVICSYAYREPPYSIKLMFSQDNGKTWDTDHTIYAGAPDGDLGYPATVQLSDGSFMTVFYAHPKKNEPCVILQQKWMIDE